MASVSKGKEEAVVLQELNILIAGSADNGKSSLIGVLTTEQLDNGNGSARDLVSRHQHERDSGKTSDIGVHTVLFGGKTISLIDLCGQQKYFRTTLRGITGNFADYAVVVIAANNGILPMTLEHIRVLLCLKIPFAIVITRVDLVLDKIHIYEKTVHGIKKALGKHKTLNIINGINDETFPAAASYAKLLGQNPDTTPVITISNKTGYGINFVREFISELTPHNTWSPDQDTVFYIESAFNPPGIGLVVSGMLKGRSVTVGDELLIGPIDKEFYRVRIRSMHNNTKNPIETLNNRERGCFALRSLDKRDLAKHNIRKGCVIVGKSTPITTAYQFEASIQIFSTTVSVTHKYSPMIHCGMVRQAAKIDLPEDVTVRGNEEINCKFRFLLRPEFLEVGTRFFLTESLTRGVGVITGVLKIEDDPKKYGVLLRCKTGGRVRRRQKNTV